MYIEELKLKDYRNYNHLDIKFNSQVNAISCGNAQGKTNLVEELYILAFTNSYRTTNDQALNKWQAEFANISSILHKKDRSIPLEMLFHKQGKKAKINH